MNLRLNQRRLYIHGSGSGSISLALQVPAYEKGSRGSGPQAEGRQARDRCLRGLQQYVSQLQQVPESEPGREAETKEANEERTKGAFRVALSTSGLLQL
jgi:hypothetical protein